jgi:diguanylate cyclase (GGDEF)-like protein
MNLSKRAAFLIFPVIAAGYTLAAIQVYSSQGASIVRMEQTRLDNRLVELKSSYDAYENFINAFVLNVSEGEKLRDFLREKDDAYRIISLRNGMDRYVSSFQQNDDGTASFALIGPDLETKYYFEDSTNPFSTTSPAQLEFAERLFETNQFEGRIHHVDDDTSRIIHGQILDATTFKQPVRINIDQSVLLVASIQPVTYDRLLAETKAEYRAGVSYLTAPPQKRPALNASAQLSPGHFLHVEVDPDYLATIKAELRSWLAAAVILLSLSTFALLMFLIRKFITQPVSELDRQLELVVQGKLDNIEKPTQVDEIGRLGIKFHDLFEKLSHALDHTRAMSRTDSLTGLPNRTAFSDIAQARISEAKTSCTDLSFVYVDLDNFKFVNDKYGHDVGDNLLQAFARRMLNLVELHRANGAWMQMFRLSGDEFAIVVQGRSNAEIEKFSQAVLSLFERGFRFEQGTFPVTASLGIASYPHDGHTVTQLISNADLAMYQAKHQGKHRYAFYSRGIAEQSRRRVDIEEQLNNVEPDEEFHLVYMPIVNRSRQCVCYEVLLRWESPVLGNVSPAEFIPIAESNGEFMKIDRWVIDRSIATLPTIQQRFGESIRLSINISSAQLGSIDIKDYLDAVIRQHGVSALDIDVEITETYNLEPLENVLDRLNVFRDQDFGVVIDDFGVGNTSLMQLVDCPIDKIKLDREFIDRVTRTDQWDLVAAFIELCHIQDIEVTAEGVETEQQYQLLLDAGCDYLQGYYFAKPKPLSELALYHPEVHPSATVTGTGSAKQQAG